jgi:N-acetylglucosaminyl-diphospho-decaprenol L-rhamnosyltransferase
MPSPDPRLAIVMITHNRRDEVLRSLAHLAELPEQPRTVLVDNASVDGTAAVVAERFPHVQVLAAGSNLGAAARTLGAREVQEPYIAFCDDDTWWEPGCLRRAADRFDAHPQLAVLTGRVLVGPEERLDPTCHVMDQSPLLAQPGMPGRPLLGFLAGASVIRRDAFLAVGDLPRHVFLGGEEAWIAADLADRGWWLCYAPDLVVHHYPSQQRDAGRRRWQQLRNALWFVWLRRPMTSAALRTLWLARTAEDWSLALRGFGAALAGLPWMLPQRRVVAPHVEAGFRRLEGRERDTWTSR